MKQQQKLQHWQRVKMDAYRRLGYAIATLEAIDQGKAQPPSEKVAAATQGEGTLAAERFMALKAGCRLLLNIIERSVEAVCDRSVGNGEDLAVYAVRIETGEEVADRLASAGGSAEARRN